MNRQIIKTNRSNAKIMTKEARPEFTHLHTHSEYSIVAGRDGMNKADELPKVAKEQGMDAIALTDHGLLAGVKKFVDACEKEKVKPIIGCELYCPPGFRSMDVREKDEADKAYYHFLALATNIEGYRNLCKLNSMSYTNGFYYRPRVDLETIEAHKEGLVFTTACIGGGLAQSAFDYDDDRSLVYTTRLKEMFGDKLFLEVQPHHSDRQAALNLKVLELGKILNIPIVGTNDVHYAHQPDWQAHFELSCIARKATLNSSTYEAKDYGQYIKTPQEMWNDLVVNASLPTEAITNTKYIADLCDGTYFNQDVKLPMPKFPSLGDDFSDAQEMLSYVAKWGLVNKFGGDVSQVPQAYKDRLNYELSVIQAMGYSDYFLIVWDYVKHANDCGIAVGPGRGSGAGSLVCWALGITKPDPIKYGLFFERFLNPDRVSMPDLDIDFQPDRIGELHTYLQDKYGHDKVAFIGAYGRFFAKGEVRDLARVHDKDFNYGSEIAKRIPDPIYGKNLPMEKILEQDPTLSNDYPEIIATALKIDGNVRHRTEHACGVIVAPTPLGVEIPTYVVQSDDSRTITQWDHEDLEKVGGVKFDFLKLDTLSAIATAYKLIKQRHNIEYPIDFMPEDGDEATYQTIADGHLNSLFQIETSRGMKDIITQAQPKTIEELSDLLALYRPGPIDAGFLSGYMRGKATGNKAELIHQKLADTLAPTMNVPVYQEQLMKLGQELAGYSLAEADLLRRAIGKKKQEEMAKLEPEFIERLRVHSQFSKQAAINLWQQLESWANYGFNKAHSISYAMLTYLTAWLKTHYPNEYLCGVLAARASKEDKVRDVLKECKRLGIPVVGIDINSSVSEFTLRADGAILYGLSALHGLGEKAAEEIINARGIVPYIDIYDFLHRVDNRAINSRTFGVLCSVGAFDSLGYDRQELTTRCDEIYEAYRDQKSYREKLADYQERLEDIKRYIKKYGDIPGSKKENRTRPRAKKEPEAPTMPELKRNEKTRLTIDALIAEYKVTKSFLSAHPGDFLNIHGDISYAADLVNLPKGSERYVVLIFPIEEPLWQRNNMYLMSAEDRAGDEVLVFLRGNQYDIISKAEGLVIVSALAETVDDESNPPKIKLTDLEVLLSN